MAEVPSEESREALTCAVCTDIFMEPKLLPCSHTFCKKCLEDIVSHLMRPSFPCPMCRKNIEIPAGGVSALQNNFYIQPQFLEKAKNWKLCMSHGKILEFFCTRCSEAICINCKLTEHESHPTQDLSKAAANAKGQLTKDQSRMQSTAVLLIQRLEAAKTEQQAVQDKKAAVESAIRRKHATLVAMADKFRDDSLASLNTVTTQQKTNIETLVEQLNQNLNEAFKLQDRINQTFSRGEHCELLTVAREMTHGRGSADSIKNLTSKKMTSGNRAVLQSSVTDSMMMEHVSDFFGTVSSLQVEVTAPGVKVVEQFRCGEEPDIEVFSLCPYDDGSTVWMSFVRRGLKEDAPSEKFAEKGEHLYSQNVATGKSTRKGRDGGKGIYHLYLSKTEWLCTFDKSQRKTIFCLDNNSSGKADINTTKVTSEDPFKSEDTTEFTILVGAHRALDVDSSEQLFVVVEEAQAPDGQRKVHLYRRGQQAAVATYSPPTARCRPSDVCFYKVAGQERLVVADEATDSLHVVSVQGGEMRFERYLAPGCPLLVQPTALNTDTQGRLWVACRGGAILTITPFA